MRGAARAALNDPRLPKHMRAALARSGEVVAGDGLVLRGLTELPVLLGPPHA